MWIAKDNNGSVNLFRTKVLGFVFAHGTIGVP